MNYIEINKIINKMIKEVKIVGIEVEVQSLRNGLVIDKKPKK